MDCVFQIAEPGLLRCKVCEREVRTHHPPGRVSAECKLRGIGDAVAVVTTWLGIESCEGCRKRQKQFNELWSYEYA